MLLFLGVWGGYIGFSAAFFAVVALAFSLDEDAQSRKVTFDLLRATFWPLSWAYLRLTGKTVEPGSELSPESTDRRDRIPSGTANSPSGFRTVREAKDYLASRIADEADLEGSPLSEVERKMLYFTETGWTLPDMKQVSAEFDREYDPEEYERKIAGLADKICARDEGQRNTEQERWDCAVEKLSRGDHYLLVSIGTPPSKGKPENWWRHSLKVAGAALVLLAFGALDLWIRHWMRDH
jgi:hypothetical protein